MLARLRIPLLLILILALVRAAGADGAGTPAVPTPELKSRPDLGLVYAWEYPNLQAAVDALKDGGTVYLGTGSYRLSKPLDLTGRIFGRNDTYPRGTQWVALVGMGKEKTSISADYKEGPVIDLTGSNFCRIESLTINGPVGVLCDRLVGIRPSSGHYFNDVLFHCSKVCLYLSEAEECRVNNCRFTVSAPGGTCLWFSNRNSLGIKSVNPTQRTAGNICSTTELRVTGSCCYFDQPGAVGVRIEGCSSSDATFIGMYMAGGEHSPAAFLLDGRGGCVSNVHLQDVRQEGGQYSILYAGTVRHVTVQGGFYGYHRGFVNYYNFRPANQRDGLPDDANRVLDAEFPNLFNTPPTLLDGNPLEMPTIAENWTIFADNWPWPLGNGAEKDAEGYTKLLRFNRLVDSYIRLGFGGYRDAGIGCDVERYRLVIDEESTGNVIQLPRSDMLAINGKSTATSVLAFNDFGVQRTYLGAKGALGVLNLTPTDVTKIPHPQPGDLALDSGANTPTRQPALAFYDGKQWLFVAGQPLGK